VLSGLLADGTLGAAAINRAGGITMAQSAASSEYFDMPASAIDIGRADVVAAPAQLARYLMLLAEIGVSKHAA
jgi:chemotaxis response regulator CheB